MTDGQSLKKARSTAYRLLGIRARTRRQLQDALAAKGFCLDIIEEVITEATEAGFVNDNKFAEDYIISRLSRQPRGPRYLLAALLRSGVEYDVAARAVGTALDAEYEQALAARLVGKAVAGGITARDKLLRMLLNRGFTPGVARKAVEEELGAHLDIMF